MRRIVSDEDVRKAILEPPPDTRACIRGGLISKVEDQILSVHWSHITLRHGNEPLTISLANMFSPDQIETWRTIIQGSETVADARTESQSEAAVNHA